MRIPRNGARAKDLRCLSKASKTPIGKPAQKAVANEKRGHVGGESQSASATV